MFKTFFFMNYNASNCEMSMPAFSYSVDFLLFKPILGPQEGLNVQQRGNLKSSNTMLRFMILFRNHSNILKYLYQVQEVQQTRYFTLYIVKPLTFLGLWSSKSFSWFTISTQDIFIKKYIQVIVTYFSLFIIIYSLIFYWIC